ncbi:hypothetical protein EW026_g4644 [Hermanssonia centrifuga]|uniref:THUMP domain-containing protein n=1 Tax=Hermanssonia centrifuga TaxID=98765 RepID=A0A4S4KI84_9APHY|nr:hypothetical protein EW026_g4644 [Hermanssonia centrifuga]
MSEGKGKRKSDARDKPRRRFNYDGTPIQRSIDGPSVWVTCVRGKERQAVGELYDLFGQLASELWPDSSLTTGGASIAEDSDDDADSDIEKAIAKEVSSMKRPRKEQRFANYQTSTSCFVVLSCKSPVDPVLLVTKHVGNVLEKGYTQRLSPISATCSTNLQEMKTMLIRLLQPFLSADEEKVFSYKIELRTRNHNTLSRPQIVQELATCVPAQHKVNLEDPEVFILVEIFKSTCGMSIVRDYYRLQKFNVMEIAKTEEPGFKPNEGRISQRMCEDLTGRVR